jgi:anthranilate synthase component 1
MGGFQIVGSSPEILVRLEDGVVTVRPIAGTRPAAHTEAEDLPWRRNSWPTPRSWPSTSMLMDLGRNDAGRVAQVGSVKVTENMIVERYSHVMHIVSNVDRQAEAEGLNAMDVLRATFPAGTVSGAPKIRAMEIIDELEPSKRGIYAGAVGYVLQRRHGHGHRHPHRRHQGQGQLYVQAGAGIVADSVPANEWQETRNKARAVFRAAELAQVWRRMPITMPPPTPCTASTRGSSMPSARQSHLHKAPPKPPPPRPWTAPPGPMPAPTW